MPLLITMGLGVANNPTSFALSGITVFSDRLEIQFNQNVQVVGAAAIPSQWVITTAVPGAPVPAVNSIVTAGPKIKLFLTEMRDGVTYTLQFPVIGIKDIFGNLYPGPYSVNFTGVGIPPFVSLAGASDAFHVKVIFSEPVVQSEALNPANYLITGGTGLTVYQVTAETQSTYILRTSQQVVGQTYTVTVSGIHDLFGNLF